VTVDDLKLFLETQPFEPFAIYMSDGRVFVVKHRDFISRSPSGRTIIVHEENDSFSILDTPLISRMERLQK
jgi:hypothetical protein